MRIIYKYCFVEEAALGLEIETGHRGQLEV